MLRKMKAGSVSQSIPIFVTDTSSSVGAGLGSLVFGTAGLAAKYRRAGDSTWTTITLATMTLGTWATGGFIADGGGVTGGYEFGIPNAVLATGVEWAEIEIYGAANMLAVLVFIELDAVNYQDSVRFGVTALPNAAANAAGGLPISIAGALDLDEMNADVEAIQTGVVVTTNNDKTGYGLSATAVQAIWDALTSALTTAGSIGLKLKNWVLGTDNKGLISSDVHTSGVTVAAVSGAVGSVTSGVTVTTNNDKAGYALTAGEHTNIAADVLDVAQSSHNTAGTIGNKIGAAASAGDPWSTALPGAYGAGSAGKIVGTNLDAVVSAVKAKTDALNFTGANVQSTPQTNVSLNMAQAVPTSNTAQTVGDALNAARSQGFGKWTLSGTTLTLYAGDGSTVVRTFTLDSSSNPTQRV